MRTSIGILDDGAYEVSAYRTDGTGYGQWIPLRAFASQGDAREFAERDVPRFTDAQLSALAKTCVGSRSSRRGFLNYRRID
nr:MAG TPA: hypothetical protein [Caudoviricetes sp.]